MITVCNLLDDQAFGGVTRFLDALAPALTPAVQQSRRSITPQKQLPPALDVDVVVVHFTISWAKLPYLLALRAIRGRRPIVLVEHSYTDALERIYVRQPRRFRTMLRLTYGLADRVVAVSYGQAAWMRRARLLDATKLVVIPPFTDCTDLPDLPRPVRQDGPLRLGAFGRYCPQKDFATLVAAMRHVDPATATLELRGFGPDADALRAAAADLPHVAVGDRIDDLSAFLATRDAIVVPSMFEPFGQVALEARLAGRPVIVTDVDGLPEQIAPEAGLIVPAGDPKAMAEAIRTMAHAHRLDQWPAMTRAARDSATGHVATSTEHWLSLLQTLAAASPLLHPTTPHRATPAALQVTSPSQ